MDECNTDAWQYHKACHEHFHSCHYILPCLFSDTLDAVIQCMGLACVWHWLWQQPQYLIMRPHGVIRKITLTYFLAGVTALMIPIPWKVLRQSLVRTLLLTWYTGHIQQHWNFEEPTSTLCYSGTAFIRHTAEPLE